MFSRWMFARLRAAENALHQGRIDEALRRLSEPDVRDDRRAQKLTDELARALLARARVQAQGGSYRDALSDLQSLEALGRFTPDAEALRKRAEDELRARVGRHQAREEAFAKAAADVQQGRLESGRLAVEKLEDPQGREQLREELDIRVQRSAQLLDQANEALRRGDLLTACRLWEEACERHGRSRPSDELAGQLVAAYRTAMDEWFRAGRLERMLAGLDATRALRLFAPELNEYENRARLLRRAVEQLAGLDSSGLHDTLLRLRAAGDAEWISPVMQAAQQIAEARGALLASPLGLLGLSLHRITLIGTPPARGEGHNGGVERPAAGPPGAALAGGLLLLIDGTGSSLLTTRDLLRIGRAGGGREIDVPIPADIQSHHADVVRDGEDYFLIARGPVRVNRQPVVRRLLRDGDRVVFGPNAKLTFRKPSVKSDTAVLLLSDRCRLPRDVSSVVLFRGTCVLGPQPSCHVQTREGDSRLVLFERHGELYVRKAARDGQPTGPAAPLPMRQTKAFGDVRMTVREYEPG